MGEVVEENIVTHYIKKYPDRLVLIEFKNPYPADISNSKVKKSARSWARSEEEELDSIEEALQKAKTKISDIVICNHFDMFVTFTFNCRACVPKCKNKSCTCDRSTCTRYDLDYVRRTQKAWYNNQIKKYGRFSYVQVMELHKDKGHKEKAYHFHALFNNYKGPLKYWKTSKDGRPIYRLGSNKKGWTTVKYIYDRGGVASYIKKYIVKDMPTFPGKKRFWPSQGLNRPIVVQDCDLMERIRIYPEKEVWMPEEKPMVEKHGTAKKAIPNLKSMTTVKFDNQDAYFEELRLLNFRKRVGKIFGGVQHGKA